MGKPNRTIVAKTKNEFCTISRFEWKGANATFGKKFIFFQLCGETSISDGIVPISHNSPNRKLPITIKIPKTALQNSKEYQLGTNPFCQINRTRNGIYTVLLECISIDNDNVIIGKYTFKDGSINIKPPTTSGKKQHKKKHSKNKKIEYSKKITSKKSNFHSLSYVPKHIDKSIYKTNPYRPFFGGRWSPK